MLDGSKVESHLRAVKGTALEKLWIFSLEGNPVAGRGIKSRDSAELV